MRWFWSLLLAVLLPLQSAGAVTEWVCDLHPDHVHAALQDDPDDADARDGAAERECHDACHHFSAVLGQWPAVAGLVPALPVATAAPQGRAGPLMPRPERPQWPSLA